MAVEPAAHTVSVPFRAGTERYASFRIPAAVTAADGTVLAFAEGRVASPEDYGDIDLVLRRSGDGGRTWGPLTVVDKNGRDTAGNPAPVVLANGRILLVYIRSAADATERRIRRGEVPAADGRRVWVRHSDDHGETWWTVHTVDGLPAAYSDLVRLDPSCVGLLYETGDFNAYTTITFRRIPVEELS
jgi:sialidase-1